MRPRRRKLLTALALAALPMTARAEQRPVRVVAAENFYGDIISQIGGGRVQVLSVLDRPDQDPHMFEASVSTARALSHARLVVYNGGGYDPWMKKLLAAAKSPGRRVVITARLLDAKPGANPHFWYDPAVMPVVAEVVAAALEALDPAGAPAYLNGLAQVREALRALRGKVAVLRARYAGTPVTATEPVFGYMAEALGFVVRNTGYQLAVMNDVEPGASQVAAFEKDLETRRVKILFYNKQVTDASTTRARRLAEKYGVPVVGVTETMPAGLHYQSWMLNQLAAVENALADGRR